MGELECDPAVPRYRQMLYRQRLRVSGLQRHEKIEGRLRVGEGRRVSNFVFLRAEWPDLFNEALRAERNTLADPRTACFYARRALEISLKWLYDADDSLRTPYKNDLSGLIYEPSLRALVGNPIQTKMDIIRKRGNAAVHHAAPIKPNEALPVVRELFHVLYWVARRYTRDPKAVPPSALAFNPDLIPRPAPAAVRQQSQTELKALSDKLAAQDAALAAEREKERQPWTPR